MTKYDPQVINQYADRLYTEAERAPIMYGFASGIVGMTIGLGMGVGLESGAAGVVVAVLLAPLAGFVGFTAGKSVSSRMRLIAQTALVQVEIANDLRKIATADD